MKFKQFFYGGQDKTIACGKCIQKIPPNLWVKNLGSNFIAENPRIPLPTTPVSASVAANKKSVIELM
jgi:hypothetical protein